MVRARFNSLFTTYNKPKSGSKSVHFSRNFIFMLDMVLGKGKIFYGT